MERLVGLLQALRGRTANQDQARGGKGAREALSGERGGGGVQHARLPQNMRTLNVTNAALRVMLDAEVAPCALLMLLTSARHVIAHDVTEANVPEPLNKN